MPKYPSEMLEQCSLGSIVWLGFLWFLGCLFLLDASNPFKELLAKKVISF